MGANESKEPQDSIEARHNSIRRSSKNRRSSTGKLEHIENISKTADNLKNEIDIFAGSRSSPRYKDFQKILSTFALELHQYKTSSKKQAHRDRCDEVLGQIQNCFQRLETKLTFNEQRESGLDLAAVESHSFLAHNFKKPEEDVQVAVVRKDEPKREEPPRQKEPRRPREEPPPPKPRQVKYESLRTLDALELETQKLEKEVKLYVELQDTKQFIVFENKIKVLYIDLELIRVDDNTPLSEKKASIGKRLIKCNNYIKRARKNIEKREKEKKIEEGKKTYDPDDFSKIDRLLEDLEIQALTYEGVKHDPKYKELEQVLESHWTKLYATDAFGDEERKRRSLMVEKTKNILQELRKRAEENETQGSAIRDINAIEQQLPRLKKDVNNFQGDSQDAAYIKMDQELRALWDQLSNVEEPNEHVKRNKMRVVRDIQETLKNLSNISRKSAIYENTISIEDEIFQKQLLNQVEEFQNHWNQLNYNLDVSKVTKSDISKAMAEMLDKIQSGVRKKTHALTIAEKRKSTSSLVLAKVIENTDSLKRRPKHIFTTSDGRLNSMVLDSGRPASTAFENYRPSSTAFEESTSFIQPQEPSFTYQTRETSSSDGRFKQTTIVFDNKPKDTFDTFKPPLSNNKPPIPDSKPPIPDSKPPIPDSKLPIPDSKPPIPDSKLPITGNKHTSIFDTFSTTINSKSATALVNEVTTFDQPKEVTPTSSRIPLPNFRITTYESQYQPITVEQPVQTEIKVQPNVKAIGEMQRIGTEAKHLLQQVRQSGCGKDDDEYKLYECKLQQLKATLDGMEYNKRSDTIESTRRRASKTINEALRALEEKVAIKIDPASVRSSKAQEIMDIDAEIQYCRQQIKNFTGVVKDKQYEKIKRGLTDALNKLQLLDEVHLSKQESIRQIQQYHQELETKLAENQARVKLTEKDAEIKRQISQDLRMLIEQAQKLKSQVDRFTGVYGGLHYKQIAENIMKCSESLQALETKGNEKWENAKVATVQKLEKFLRILEDKATKSAEVQGEEEEVQAKIVKNEVHHHKVHSVPVEQTRGHSAQDGQILNVVYENVESQDFQNVVHRQKVQRQSNVDGESPHHRINSLRDKLVEIKSKTETFSGKFKDEDYAEIEKQLLGCSEELKDIEDRGHKSVIISKEQYADYIEKLFAYFEEKTKALESQETSYKIDDPTEDLAVVEAKISELQIEIDKFAEHANGEAYKVLQESLNSTMDKLQRIQAGNVVHVREKKRKLARELQNCMELLKIKAASPKPNANDQKQLVKIYGILEELNDLSKKVEEFEGTKNDTEYCYLDEMLIRLTIKLDNTETHGSAMVKDARKKAIQEIQKNMKLLSQKVMERANVHE